MKNESWVVKRGELIRPKKFIRRPPGEMSYREIGQVMGISGTRVEQIERGALKKLRKMLDIGIAKGEY